MAAKKIFGTILDVKNIILFFFFPIILLPLIFNIDGDAGKCAYGMAVLITFWVFEIVPMAVTSLLPVVLFPILGVLTAEKVCSQYMKDSTMTVIGIFAIVAAVERVGLLRRMALGMLMLFGTKPHWLILGMLVSTSVLSLFITAGVAVLMVPIVRSMVDKLKDVDTTEDVEMKDVSIGGSEDQEAEEKHAEDSSAHEEEIARLYKALCLCVGYGTILGSTGTLTGAPVHFVMVGLLEQLFSEYDLSSQVTFINWFVFAFPLTVIIVVLCWVWFVIYFLRGKGLFRRTNMSEAMRKAQLRVKEHIREEYKELGEWSYAQVVVLVFLILLVVFFITQDLYFVPGWGSLFKKGYVGASAPVCILAALLFIIPAKSPKALLTFKPTDPEESRFSPILTWSAVNNTLPWGVLLLIGAAYALVKAATESGLRELMGQPLIGLAGLDPWIITFVVTSLTTFMTEFVSNAATITMFVPVVSQVAILANINPLALVFPLTLAAKFAFMMPIASPPNAIVYSMGALRVRDMASAGFVLNFITLFCLNVACNTWGEAYFDWYVIPDAMRLNRTILLNNTLAVSS